MTDPTQMPMGEGPGITTPSVKGPIRQNASELAAHLRRTPIALGVILLVTCVIGVGYVAVDMFSGSGGSTPRPKLDTGHQAPVFRVPQKVSKIQAPTASATSPSQAASPSRGTTPSAKTASTGNALTGSTPESHASFQAQPTPGNKAQDAAFKTALDGGIHVVAWQDGGGAAAPAAADEPAVTPMKVPQIPAKGGQNLTSGANGVYSTHLVRKEVSPYELLQGTVIPALLESGIKSDISGLVKAVVSHPVYNSLNGASVLIPAGSTLIGSYASGAAMGQNRVAVQWTRIEFPNGTYLQLGSSMPGTSPAGYAGFRDLVNNHTWTIFKNALLLSLIDVGMAMSSPTSTSTNTTGVTGNQALQNGEQALAQTFGEAEAQMFQRDINIAPTMTIRPGYAFNVIVTRDLVFPEPYVHGLSEVGTTRTELPAAPSMTNPYKEP